MRYQIQILQTVAILLLSTVSLAQNHTDDPQGAALGDTIPNFSLIDQNSEVHQLHKALENGPVVIIFYRGEWCPVCNKHLSNIQDSSEYILEKNAEIWAISPQKIERIEKTADKTDAVFTLLYDKGYEVGTLFDVMFSPTKGEVTKYNTFLRADLENAHDQDTLLLPVPATFVIDTNGVVKWRQFDMNYKNRSTVSEIINHL